MSVDSDIIVKIVTSVVSAVIVASIARWRELRPKLISYYGQSAALGVPNSYLEAIANKPADELVAVGPDAPPLELKTVHTHSIVIRNYGKKSAFNVRIGHSAPVWSYVMYPNLAHECDGLISSGNWELQVPVIAPGEQIQISYLYDPKVFWNHINSYIKSDEALAKHLSNTLPRPMPSTFVRYAMVGVFYIGVLASGWFVAFVAQWLYQLFVCCRPH